jgi:hypothetical protein
MHCHCSGTASTHNNHAIIVLAWVKVDQMCPPHEACTFQDMICFAALANATLGTIYTDITGAFPVRSFKNMQYIFVAYIYNLNAIIMQPMPFHTDIHCHLLAILRARDYQPALNMMDNECSNSVEKHILANKMDIQLAPLHYYHVNAAEHAIARFKEHFVAALATVDMLCPLQLWDKFLPQGELTLNLLRFSHRNPCVSVN